MTEQEKCPNCGAGVVSTIGRHVNWSCASFGWPQYEVSNGPWHIEQSAECRLRQLAALRAENERLTADKELFREVVAKLRAVVGGSVNLLETANDEKLWCLVRDARSFLCEALSATAEAAQETKP